MAKYGIFILVFSLLSCIPHQTETNMIPAENARNLIPFAEYDSKREQKWGYVDEDTGEVIIKAQYVYVTPFVGNYAAVKTGWHDYQKIINKNGKILPVGQFDVFHEVYFITSENGKSTAAILENHYKRTKFTIGGGWQGAWSTPDPHFYKEDYYKYRLVNLTTGRTIIPKRENYLELNVEVVGDYFVADTDLYQFMDNGDIKCVAKKDPALAVSILQDYLASRGINAVVKGDSVSIDIDYRPYIREKFADPDLSGAFKDLPPEFNVPFESYEPFYRDHRDFLNAPLAINERKYLLHFYNDKTGERAVAIYNESKGERELGPRFLLIYEHENDKKVPYYIVDIAQTNNPHLYRIGLANDDVGWVWGRSAYVSGGIYSVSERDFMPDLYLFENYPPSSGTILMPGGSGERLLKFPNYGVYYRDYGRIKAKTPVKRQNLAHSGYVIAVAFSPDGKTVISGDRKGKVVFWDAHSGDIIRSVPISRPASRKGMAISPDGKSVAVGTNDCTVKIWNASEQISTLEGHNHWVNAVAFSPDGKTVVSGQEYGGIILWDLESKEPIRTFAPQKDYAHKDISALAVSPDGKTIVSGDDFGGILFWDAQSGQFIRNTPRLRYDDELIVISPDGKYMVTSLNSSSYKTLVLLNLASGSSIRTFRGHKNYVYAAAFSPDGKTIVSGDKEGKIIVWNRERGEQLLSYEGHTPAILSIAFSPDGKYIVSGAGNEDEGEVKIWDAATGALIRTFDVAP